MNLKDKYPQLDILMDTEKQHGAKVIALYDYAIKMELILFFRQIRMGRRIRKNLKLFGR